MKKIIKWVIIPAILFLLWIGLSVIYVNDAFGITGLDATFNANNFSVYKTTELLAGQKIEGRITVPFNNLGIISVRFNTFGRINNDSLIFRIKDIKSSSWYYQNSYLVNQFQPNQFFTFGFPVISDSKDHSYVFELISTKGKHNDAIALSKIEPVIDTKFQYTKHELLANKSELTFFLIHKVENIFINASSYISIIIYALPLIFYLVWQKLFTKYLVKKYYLSIIPLLIILLTSLFIQSQSDITLFVLLALWIFMVVQYKLEGNINFIATIVFLVATQISLLFGKTADAQNTAIWAYLFLWAGLLQQIIELKYRWKNSLNYKTYTIKVWKSFIHH